MNKANTLTSIPSVLLIFLLFSGCENGPMVMSYGEPAIFAELNRAQQRDSTVQNVIEVSVGGTRLVPVVSVNNDTLELYYYQKNQNTYNSEFRGYLSVEPGDECELVVYHDEGEATAKITLPGDFEIISPKEDSALRQNEDLIVGWSPSEGEGRYKLDIDLYYYYFDTSGVSSRFDLDTNFYAITHVTIPKEKLFPPEVDSIESGFGRISIYPESGPWIGHTIEGNISGDGVGYFVAYSHIAEKVYFTIGNTSIIYIPFEPPDPILIPTEQFKKHLEYLKNNDPTFMGLQ
jgi:hypothetical protein